MRGVCSHVGVGAGDVIHQMHATDGVATIDRKIDLLISDPPYAMGGDGAEHALSATVAVALRAAGEKLGRGRWAVVFAASSWRSTYYIVEALRGVAEPVRIATWVKPKARTKTRTPALRTGCPRLCLSETLIEHEPLMVGRRAQLPIEVAMWAARPFAVDGGLAVDPFAGSGTLLRAAGLCGMATIGFEVNP